MKLIMHMWIKIQLLQLCAQFAYKDAMAKVKHIFYGWKRSDKAVRKFIAENDIKISKHSTGVDLILIDVTEDRPDLETALVLCEMNPGTVVWLMQLSDLGKGAKSNQVQKMFKATKAKLVVPERVLGKRGPKPKHGLTDEQIERYRPLYAQKAVTRQYVCDTILRDTGVRVTRHQLRTIYKK